MPIPEPITGATLTTLSAGDAAEKGQRAPASEDGHGPIPSEAQGGGGPAELTLLAWGGPGPWVRPTPFSSTAEHLPPPLLRGLGSGGSTPVSQFPYLCKGATLSVHLVGNQPPVKSACMAPEPSLHRGHCQQCSPSSLIIIVTTSPAGTDHGPAALSSPLLCTQCPDSASSVPPGFATVQSPQSRAPGGCF